MKPPTVCVSGVCAGRDSLRENEKLEARKMHKKPFCTHLFSVRCVSRTFSSDLLCLLTRLSVKAFPEQISMAIVSRILTNQLLQIPTNAVSISSPIQVERLVLANQGVRSSLFPFPSCHRFGNHRGVCVEIPRGAVIIVVAPHPFQWHIGTQCPYKVCPFQLGQMPYKTEQT